MDAKSDFSLYQFIITFT